MNKFLIVILALSLFGCKNAANDTSSYSVDSTAEAGQQVGDAMASVDEAGGTTNGGISMLEMRSAERAFARIAPHEISTSQALFSRILNAAEATSCNAVAFSACSSNQRVRSFAGCSTIAGGSISGDVTLSFSGTGAASCTIPNSNDNVSRVPNYSINGLRGATFAVSALSTGQNLKRTGANTFDFSNAGIRRSFVTPKGNTILDITTTTGSAIQVTGNSRASRTLNGGSLIVTNNLSGVSCTMTPNSVSWTSGCNCPTSGNWSGSCSDSSTMSVTFSGTCGQATVAKGTDSSNVIMDRCQ